LDVYQESNRDNSEEMVSVNTTMQIGENSNASLTLSQSEHFETSRLINTPKVYFLYFLYYKVNMKVMKSKIFSMTKKYFKINKKYFALLKKYFVGLTKNC
jgi:hypothetical protein